MKKYTEVNRPQNQKNIIEGICVNPALRNDFNNTKNSDRPDQETADWWGRAFILSQEYKQSDDSYPEYVKRITGHGSELGFELQEKTDWELKQKENMENFLSDYPTGKAYLVKVLDGGAWDRSSLKAQLPSLDEAINLAKLINKQNRVVT